MQNSEMTTGDTKPDLKMILSATDPVDITSAISVRIIGKMKRSGVEKFDRAPSTAEYLGDGTSLVTMEWQTGDTSTPGDLEIEVEVTWAPGQVQTFPAENHVNLDLALG